ncbi:MAG TPA: CBS domain-containing protein [Longimicrobium sp.]|nr:CBS domain-containing protein [Longimicrobium sp.]
MARYGRDYNRDRWSGGFGQGGEFGRMNRYGGDYGGMRSDAGFGRERGFGRDEFGAGGGTYDNDFNPESGFGYSGERLRGRFDTEGGFSGRGYRDRSLGGFGGHGGAGYTTGGYGAFGGWGGADEMDRPYGGLGRSGGDELRRLRAADVMTDDPECVTSDMTLADAARKMRDLDVGIIPVVESTHSRRLRGVLTDRDIAIRAVAEGLDGGSTRVIDVMTTQVETCNKNDTLRDVMSVMEREQVRRVPITDREGRLVGIIAQADVATEVDTPLGQRRFADTLGEISEPGNPRGRGNWNLRGGRASQGRGGLLGAVRNAVSGLGGGEGSSRTGGMQGRGLYGNTDSRALNDPGAENI